MYGTAWKKSELEAHRVTQVQTRLRDRKLVIENSTGPCGSKIETGPSGDFCTRQATAIPRTLL
jgi:hypothetical protein